MKKLLLIFAFPILVFWPSLFVFFTNDDFFFLKISKINSFWEFVRFFDITKGPDGLGMYRPLTTQVFYMLKNPLLMHIVVFITFFVILYFIYVLSKKLFGEERIALIATFLYSVSAVHFAHFYYLATYQELGMALFVLLMIISHLNKRYYLSILFFVLSLMSKETAVVAPFLLLLSDWYINSKINLKKYIAYFLILGFYLFMHFVLYGVATGDSYVWDFSIRKLLNSTAWYLAWGIIPEQKLKRIIIC
jgi:Gpi18-like mannosyltransferase